MDGVLSLPLVLHFWDEHKGMRQEIMMHILSKHLNILERQVMESVLVELNIASTTNPNGEV